MREGDYNRSWLVPMLKGIAGELEDAHADVAYWYDQAETYRKLSEDLDVKHDMMRQWAKDIVEEERNAKREVETTHSDRD